MKLLQEIYRSRSVQLSDKIRAIHRKKDKYIDTLFSVPTSNIFERLFSTVSHSWSQRTRGVRPANSESQIFLHLNQDSWGTFNVNELTLT